MIRDLALPKTSPRDVAFAILDGIEAGQEDIFPDPFALDFGRRFQSSPKASERQIAAMIAAMLSGSDRKSTRLNSSHQIISYAVFCLKKKTMVHWTTSS